jgi:hypothetical protein
MGMILARFICALKKNVFTPSSCPYSLRLNRGFSVAKKSIDNIDLISCGFFIDWTCFIFALWVIELLRGWKFDEIEDKSSSTEKPNSYSGWPLTSRNPPARMLTIRPAHTSKWAPRQPE